jgi:hypothetical protein
MEYLNNKELGEPINSASLQDRHAGVYESFFSSGDIVASSDFVSSIQIGGSWRVGAPFFSFKLPFRGYVSVEFTNEENELSPGTATFYNVREDKFERIDIDYAMPTRMFPIIKERMRKLVGDGSWRGMRFNVLSEGDPRHHGYDVSMASIFGVLLLLASGQVSVEEINSLSTLSGKDIRRQELDAAKLYKRVHILATKLTRAMYDYTSSGSAAMIGMLSTNAPVIYFSEERLGSEEEKFDDLLPIQSSEDYVYDKLHTFVYTIDEFATSSKLTMPFDIVSIYPGRSRPQRQVSYYLNETYIPGFDELRDRVKKLFPGSVDVEGAPPWLLQTEKNGVYWQQYSRGNAIAMLEIIVAFIDAYIHRADFGQLSRFLELVSLMGAGYKGLSSTRVQDMINVVRRVATDSGVPIGIHNNSYRQFDGNLNIFSPRQMFRSDLSKVMEELRENVNSDINFDYISWRDGHGGPGMRVDQYVEKGLRSSHVPRGSVKVTHYEGDITKSNVERVFTMPDADIVLDAVKGKFFVKGSPVTSKDLPSQKAAVIFMQSLLSNDRLLGKEDMPKGSYFAYRNELTGKIVSPLVKIVKSQLGRDLGIEISGGLTRFQVKWKHDGISIAIVEPLD